MLTFQKCMNVRDLNLRMLHALKNNNNFFLPGFLIYSACVCAVSYTHLDVYKRQGLHAEILITGLTQIYAHNTRR